MDREAEYLQIQPEYSKHLGGLRWCPSGYAVETSEGGTFALGAQISLFLEGLFARGRLLHFCHVLHLMRLLAYGDKSNPLDTIYTRNALSIAVPFISLGRPLRNAGAFCAWLCRDVPPIAAPIDRQRVCGLARSVYSWKIQTTLLAGASANLEESPSMSSVDFESTVLQALQSVPTKDIEHWLRHGCPPEKSAGEQLAREMPQNRPRTLAGALAELTRRPRLAGAVPFVSQLVSALALPPRRLAHHELPLGGYADVTTRGHPEQILPSQFAVDDIEFVRRFAENELLYFRREEPHSQMREELVVLLDQGIRTWGPVRLVLSAAVLALGKRADRRKLPFLLARTSWEGELLDLIEADDETIGQRVEASDLSPNPGLALERVLEEESSAARDVVLLTQPRNLGEEDVSAAARRVRPGVRLFALAVDDHGQARLDEFRHGTPIKIARFQVDMNVAQTPRVIHVANDSPATAWTGDIEPIPFPFRFGIVGKIEQRGIDFSAEGDRLLTASQNGILHVWKYDGRLEEVLPRGYVEASVLNHVESVLGVAGGFVVAGRSDKHSLLVHYDFTERTAKAYVLGSAKNTTYSQLHYFSSLHSVVLRGSTGTIGIDLSTGGWDSASPLDLTSRACQAVSEVNKSSLPLPHLFLLSDQGRNEHVHWPRLFLDRATGTVTITATEKEWDAFTPLADGKPMLKGHIVLDAICRGHVLAMTCFRPGNYKDVTLHVFRGPEGVPTHEFSQPAGTLAFVLSADGTKLARIIESNLLRVHDLDTLHVWETMKGRCHPDLEVRLGSNWIGVQVGRWKHLIRWPGDLLEVIDDIDRPNDFVVSNTALDYKEGIVADKEHICHPLFTYDTKRFIATTRFNLMLIVDVFGQIAVLEYHGNLVCMFFVFRGLVAEWLPDGTRFGPAALTGGAPTVDAQQKIGAALFAASVKAPREGST